MRDCAVSKPISSKVGVPVAQSLVIWVVVGGTLRGETYPEVFVSLMLLLEWNAGLLE